VDGSSWPTSVEQTVVDGQIHRLLANGCQLRQGQQIQGSRRNLGLQDLTKAEPDTIVVAAADFHGLLYRLIDAPGWMLLVETQDADELPHPASFRPFLA
jgi:hypothetical protein